MFEFAFVCCLLYFVVICYVGYASLVVFVDCGFCLLVVCLIVCCLDCVFIVLNYVGFGFTLHLVFGIMCLCL